MLSGGRNVNPAGRSRWCPAQRFDDRRAMLTKRILASSPSPLHHIRASHLKHPRPASIGSGGHADRHLHIARKAPKMAPTEVPPDLVGQSSLYTHVDPLLKR